MDSLTTSDPGDWLKPLLDIAWHDMHAVVPRGFPAYARIFHPAQRDYPADTGTWRAHSRTGVFPIQSDQITWAAVAQTFGTTLHPLAQFHRIFGQHEAGREVLDAQGRRYSEPETGNLSPQILAATAVHLCEHTATPDQGVTGVWEGWGGLTSSAGHAEVTFTNDDPLMEGISTSAGSGPGSGLLSAEQVNGESLNLPGRAYYLFKTSPKLYMDQGWVNHVPWHISPAWPQSPNLLWPADRNWVVVTEIDFDSTVVAGSEALISALVQDHAIEALALLEGADLTWDADVPNRSPH